MIFEAAYESSAKIVDLLVRTRGRVVGSGAMHAAASQGQVKSMRVLLPHLCTRPNDSFSTAFLQGLEQEMQWTPMHFAAAEKQLKAFDWLSRHRGDATIKDALVRTSHDLVTG